jgi:hypothetical protein
VYEHLAKLALADQDSRFSVQTDPERVRTWLDIRACIAVSVTSLVRMSRY